MLRQEKEAKDREVLAAKNALTQSERHTNAARQKARSEEAAKKRAVDEKKQAEDDAAAQQRRLAQQLTRERDSALRAQQAANQMRRNTVPRSVHEAAISKAETYATQATISGVLLTYGLEIDQKDLIASIDPKFSKVYQSGANRGREWAEARAGPGAKQKNWPEPLIRGGLPYHCPPDGWVKIGIRDDNYDAMKRGSWHIVYHGTKKELVTQILQSHLRAGPRASHGQRVYVSPSIIYSSHQTYATWWDAPNGFTGVQAVLMCQVNPRMVAKKRNTLVHLGFTNQDPNNSDETIEWTLKPDLDGGWVS